MRVLNTLAYRDNLGCKKFYSTCPSGRCYNFFSLLLVKKPNKLEKPVQTGLRLGAYAGGKHLKGDPLGKAPV
jgi:hypothetical protein